MYNVDEHGLASDAFVAKDRKGKEVKVIAETPAIYLHNPKYPHNLGQTIRACACFGVKQVWWSGQRVVRELEGLDRIPREERMRGYEDVSLLYSERAIDAFPSDVVPVALEFRPNSEKLPDFVHPKKAVYVFGPEDGSLDRGILSRCHRFVFIPTKHCVNLSAAVYMVLYDRMVKESLIQ
jgi:tRNA(Leu) C34 or U34 (ribose-2'-O)-methylase TrmL